MFPHAAFAAAVAAALFRSLRFAPRAAFALGVLRVPSPLFSARNLVEARSDARKRKPIAHSGHFETTRTSGAATGRRPCLPGVMADDEISDAALTPAAWATARRISRAALSKLPVPDAIKDDVRDELLQQMRVVACAWRGEGESFAAYIAPIARWRALSLVRLRIREQSRHVEFALLERVPVEDQTLAQVEFWADLERVLSEEQRGLVELLASGKTQAEIARELGLTRKAFRMRLAKIRTLVAAALTVDL